MSGIPRPCLECGRLFHPVANRGSRCLDCQRASYVRRNHERDPFARNLYGSVGWQRLRDAVLREATECHWCHAPASATKLTADHVRGLRDYPELALEPGNVVAACRSCQERRKRRPDPATWTAVERSPSTW